MIVTASLTLSLAATTMAGMSPNPFHFLELRANIHMPLGVFSAGAARGSSEDEEAAKNMIETAGARLRCQLTAAARGRSWRGKTFAKHTSYRPLTTRTT